jgi:hypothetical protein
MPLAISAIGPSPGFICTTFDSMKTVHSGSRGYAGGTVMKTSGFKN